MQDRLQGGIPDLGFGGGQGQSKSLLAEFGAAVEGAEKLFEPRQQGLAVTLDGRFGEFAKVFDLADQVRQAELDEHATLAGGFSIGGPKVSRQAALEFLSKNVQHPVETARTMNFKTDEFLAPKAQGQIPWAFSLCPVSSTS